jgi:hypothetical protein
MGWFARLRAGLPLLQPPGPKPAGVFDHKALDQDLRSLGPDGKRCRGSGAVYARYRHAISRRGFRQKLKDAKKRRRQALSRTRWAAPLVALAIDDTHVGYDLQGCKIHSTTVQDLCSSYKLTARVGHEADGDEMAVYLEGLFSQNGAPLIMKRDNGPRKRRASPASRAFSLKTRLRLELQELGRRQGAGRMGRHPTQAQRRVHRLTSPAYTPQYNGAVEHAQGEIKGELGDRSSPRPVDEWQQAIAAAYQTLNSKPRRRLKRRNAAETFTPRHDTAMFSPEQRRHARETIDRIQQSLLDGKEPTARAEASSRRNAISIWLEQEELIAISRPQPSPY